MIVDASKTCLVLIEYQNDFCSQNGALHSAVKDVMKSSNMIKNTVSAVDKLRRIGVKIIHAPIAFDEGFHEIPKNPYGILKGVVDNNAFIKGTWGAEIIDEIKIHESDTFVNGKIGLDVFESTNLDFLLRIDNIETIAVAGFITNCCVESTLRAGYEKGFNMISLQDCTAAMSEEELKFSIEKNHPLFSKTMTHLELIKNIINKLIGDKMNKIKKIITATLSSLFFSAPFNVAIAEEKVELLNNTTDSVYHYSTLTAMRKGLYFGDAVVENLKSQGNFGIGTYNGLDGEMVVLDGTFYHIMSDGTVKVADDLKKSPFNALTFFQENEKINLSAQSSLDTLKKTLLEKLKKSHKNRFAAIKIEGDFSYVKVGGATAQPREARIPIANLMPNRPIYESNNIKGTIVGFYTPSYLDKIDINGFHFHFISNDKKFGGHLLEINSNKSIAYMDYKDIYSIQIPTSHEYDEDWKVESKLNGY
ncbi:MAG: acetolactate decarboxylase [Pseudomonadales bacterium]